MEEREKNGHRLCISSPKLRGAGGYIHCDSLQRMFEIPSLNSRHISAHLSPKGARILCMRRPRGLVLNFSSSKSQDARNFWSGHTQFDKTREGIRTLRPAGKGDFFL